MIQVVERIPRNQQRLIFARRDLLDNTTLSNNNIVDGSTVHLVLNIEGGGKRQRSSDENKNGKIWVIRSRMSQLSNISQELMAEMSAMDSSDINRIA